ncbi:acylphosphatase [Legionella quinlivanii]|uniref:Acylphosphatase n=1 Tax=Legionella quinlivanii TaxID=45073 RepID=A0A0W0XZS2_9GAMM|nr:acylphosphatase [Legionella quinlivanii]KTD49968.1 acylphosphatase [Legionella quinlivanii]MCW8450563.1 acylphosphatase [Legionella quinlivanii]SEF96212.1 acylphosphatase [Legionella quinlivanii DSM 21216]STY11256.1 acylphosphatase [Legionella quinlivanii]
MSVSCLHCFISGKVQGVWFRASAREVAEQLGIKGWARNLADGRVEVMACGDNEKLESFFIWLKQGPNLAQVTDCVREDLPWKEYSEFRSF